MSQKIITKIFNYAASENISSLVFFRRNKHLVLECYFLDREKHSLILRDGQKQDFFSNFRKLMKVAPEEFISQKYCKLPHKNGCLNFHLTIVPEAESEKIIINFLKSPTILWRLNQLGLRQPELQEIRRSLKLKSGIILVSSPDSGGKSATLNALLFDLADSDKSVYLFSKYHPFEIPGVVSLMPTSDNWEKILKLDSEVIFADDLDNKDSLKQAFRAAASGRLVFGSLKANNSWELLEKIIALPLPLKLKLDSLKMIINQRLITLKRTSYKTNPGNRQKIGLFEILLMSPDLKKIMLESRTFKIKDAQKKLEKLALKNGFRPLADDYRQKNKDGLI